jgi:hypothetical protein
MCPIFTSGHFGFGGAAGSRIYLFQLVLLLNNVHPAINFKILRLLLNVGDVVEVHFKIPICFLEIAQNRFSVSVSKSILQTDSICRNKNTLTISSLYDFLGLEYLVLVI